MQREAKGKEKVVEERDGEAPHASNKDMSAKEEIGGGKRTRGMNILDL